MDYPDAYVSYLVEFHATRDFFECHELLEEYWKEHTGDPLAETWVGFIQLAVGLYHERRENIRGALKMLSQAELRLAKAPLDELGIDKGNLLEQLSYRLDTLDKGNYLAYTDMNLELTSNELMKRCLEACEDGGLKWGEPSPMANHAVIHRHRLRDRSEVIAARLAAYEAKQKERREK